MKDSCCCGATKSNPCACMKKDIMKCSSKEPKWIQKKIAVGLKMRINAGVVATSKHLMNGNKKDVKNVAHATQFTLQ